ncbi:hypothetical protein ACP4OV_005795 [Aristida adscensionis]
MAVQAQYVTHAFPHGSGAIRPAPDNATTAEVFFGEPTSGGGGHRLGSVARGNTVFSDPRSELTRRNNNDSGCFVQRKRARVGDAGACLVMDMDGRGALLPPVPPPTFATALAWDVRSRAHGSGAVSTSGRSATSTAPAVARGLLSHVYRSSAEIDTLVRVENEKLRVALQEARRRHVSEVVAAVKLAAARRRRAAEAGLERAVARSAELEEQLRKTDAQRQAWQGVTESHEAAAAGLRATLDQLLQSPCAGAEGEGDAEDAQSCCFEASGRRQDGWRACKSCGAAEACVLVLPCRHLCLCGECEAAVDACPVCAATKNASLHVLLS